MPSLHPPWVKHRSLLSVVSWPCISRGRCAHRDTHTESKNSFLIKGRRKKPSQQHTIKQDCLLKHTSTEKQDCLMYAPEQFRGKVILLKGLKYAQKKAFLVSFISTIAALQNQSLPITLTAPSAPFSLFWRNPIQSGIPQWVVVMGFSAMKPIRLANEINYPNRKCLPLLQSGQTGWHFATTAVSSSVPFRQNINHQGFDSALLKIILSIDMTFSVCANFLTCHCLAGIQAKEVLICSSIC